VHGPISMMRIQNTAGTHLTMRKIKHLRSACNDGVFSRTFLELRSGTAVDLESIYELRAIGASALG